MDRGEVEDRRGSGERLRQGLGVARVGDAALELEALQRRQIVVRRQDGANPGAARQQRPRQHVAQVPGRAGHHRESTCEARCRVGDHGEELRDVHQPGARL